MWGVPGIDHCAALATNGPYFKKMGQTYYMRVWDKECGWISAAEFGAVVNIHLMLAPESIVRRGERPDSARAGP